MSIVRCARCLDTIDTQGDSYYCGRCWGDLTRVAIEKVEVEREAYDEAMAAGQAISDERDKLKAALKRIQDRGGRVDTAASREALGEDSMSDYAYIRATEQGPWHIYRLGHPGAVFDQPLCGQLLTCETCYSMPIVGNIDYEALTPLCESCRVAYSGLVHFGARTAETKYAASQDALKEAMAELRAVCRILNAAEDESAIDAAKRVFKSWVERRFLMQKASERIERLEQVMRFYAGDSSMKGERARAVLAEPEQARQSFRRLGDALKTLKLED